VKLAVTHESADQDGDVQKRLAKATEIMHLALERAVFYEHPPVI
jgi:hypothetical protein